MRYVNGTLLLVKDKDSNYIQKRLNSFVKIIKFTFDTFPDGNEHFLDVKGVKNHTQIYYKDTHTGEYTSFHGQTPRRFKTAWIKALFHRANKICSSKQAFRQQIDYIKILMSWNLYPKYVRNSVISRLKSQNDNINSNKDYRKVIWINVPYLGKKGEQRTKCFTRKLKRSFEENIKFKTVYKANKLSMFCNTKDVISAEQKSNVIYRITCPGCFQKYVGKIDRNLTTRLDEHGTKDDQRM